MLLDSRRFPIEISNRSSSCEKSVLIASAFLKVKALENLLTSIPSTVDIAVVSRWRAQDLVLGVSDTEAYCFCRSRGIPFGISLDFHGKLYFFDESEIFLGSANLTSRGFSLSKTGNIEFGTRFLADRHDRSIISHFLENEVVWLTDQVYEQMKREIDRADRPDLPSRQEVDIEWPSEIANQLKPHVSSLWMEEVLLHSPQELLSDEEQNESQTHDLELLGYTGSGYTEADLISGFCRTKFYRWICAQVIDRPGINIGGLSAALHQDLMDDPAPYRRDVKQIVVTAFAWMARMPEKFAVTQHKRTRSVKIL